MKTWRYILETTSAVDAETEEDAQLLGAKDIAEYVLENPDTVVVWEIQDD